MEEKKIGKYTLQGEISRGGMGVVFFGLDQQLQRRHAIKMLPKEYFTNKEQKDRFLLEARIIAKLDHQNIMKVYAYEEAEETVWIIMELLEGKLLSQLIREKGSIPVEAAAGILQQTAAALAYAHSKGIVHRDIKPANVMVGNDGVVKLMDFGIARDSEADLNLTKAGTIMGTPKYMSPEQFTGEGIDRRTDIYSLGIMAYEMICGNVPFDGKSIAEIAYKQIHEKLPPVKKKCPSVTPHLEKFITEAVAKKKDERLASLDGVNISGAEGSAVFRTAKTKINVYRAAFAALFILIVFSAGSYMFYSGKQKSEIKAAVAMLIKNSDDLFRAKEWLKAKGKLTQALALDPGNNDIRKRLGEVSKFETAESDRAKAQTVFSEALKHLAAGEMEKFRKRLEEASKLDPENADFFNRQAGEKRNAFKRTQAEQIFIKAIDALNSGDEAGFKSEFGKINEILPEEKELFEQRGMKALKTHRQARAQKIYNEALKFMDSGDEATFRQRLKEAFDLDPEGDYEKRGIAEYSEVKKRRARECIEAGVKFASDSDFDNAEKKFREAIAYDPSNAAAYGYLADNINEKCLSEGADVDYKSCCDNWEKSLELDPGNEKGWAILSQLYSEWSMKEPAKKELAMDACRRGIARFPDSVRLKSLLKTLGG